MANNSAAWQIVRGEGPLLAAAIHNGHAIRDNVRPLIALSDVARLMEEDPGTDAWTRIASTRIIGLRSRFEFDLNRPRSKAVYVHPADAWGLKVWNEELSDELIAESLEYYDAFYAAVRDLLGELVDKYGKLVVYDLHTYNHRRRGPYAPYDDPEFNPEVNLGTGTMDRQRWGPVVERFLADLRQYDFLGRSLDVRENVKFFGGNFGKWIHHEFADSVCVLAIEFKKFFMDEWTGEIDRAKSAAIQEALAATVPGVLEELAHL